MRRGRRAGQREHADHVRLAGQRRQRALDVAAGRAARAGARRAAAALERDRPPSTVGTSTGATSSWSSAATIPGVRPGSSSARSSPNWRSRLSTTTVSSTSTTQARTSETIHTALMAGPAPIARRRRRPRRPWPRRPARPRSRSTARPAGQAISATAPAASSALRSAARTAVVRAEAVAGDVPSRPSTTVNAAEQREHRAPRSPAARRRPPAARPGPARRPARPREPAARRGQRAQRRPERRGVRRLRRPGPGQGPGEQEADRRSHAVRTWSLSIFLPLGASTYHLAPKPRKSWPLRVARLLVLHEVVERVALVGHLELAVAALGGPEQLRLRLAGRLRLARGEQRRPERRALARAPALDVLSFSNR